MPNLEGVDGGIVGARRGEEAAGERRRKKISCALVEEEDKVQAGEIFSACTRRVKFLKVNYFLDSPNKSAFDSTKFCIYVLCKNCFNQALKIELYYRNQ
jgi:hypothetical protein